MNKNRGFIKWILVIIIALIVLGYYGIDVRKVAEAPTTKANISYASSVAGNVWNNYIKASAVASLEFAKKGILPFIKAHCYPQLVCDVMGGK